jgi:plasmid maintenance system antidote protein VapI
MNLQQKYDLAVAQKKEGKSLKTVKPYKTPRAGTASGQSLNF